MGNVEEEHLLLDSHILFWLGMEPGRVSLKQQTALLDARRTVYVSAASAWELGIKRAKGKLKFAGTVASMLVRFEFRELPVTIEHAERAAGLPMLHGDPFDRMLVAQALVESLTMVTVDPMLARYGVPVLL